MKRGPLGLLMSAVYLAVLAGLFLAFARAMDWDPFGAVEWVYTRLIDPIANYFSSSSWFQELTAKP